MSMWFQGIVVEAETAELRAAIVRRRTTLLLRLHRLQRDVHFVEVRPELPSRDLAPVVKVERLAAGLSVAFGEALSVHYDDGCGVRVARWHRPGKPVRVFGPADSIWVPFGPDTDLVTDGPRYAGNAIPKEVECDCLATEITVALAVTGFRAVTEATLRDAVFDERHLFEWVGGEFRGNANAAE